MRAIATATLMVLFGAFGDVLPTRAQDVEEYRPDWRTRRPPRIEHAPDPARIAILPYHGGMTEVVGDPGAAVDQRARMVRIINLRTADEVAARVLADGSFVARMLAPPGSWLQLNTSMLVADDLPSDLQTRLQRTGQIVISEIPQPHREWHRGKFSEHPTSSPGLILPVERRLVSSHRWPAFAKRLGPQLWCTGRAKPDRTHVSAGESVRMEVDLSVRSGSRTAPSDNAPPRIGVNLTCLFDAQGRQRPHVRVSASHLLTPTGLPIETHNELLAEPTPNGRKVWGPGMSSWPIPCILEESGTWRIDGSEAGIRGRYRLEIPGDMAPGIYGVSAHIHGLGDEEYFPGEPFEHACYIGLLRIGEPAPPRLACLLLGSAGTGGSRGVVAREDRGHFGINPRNVFMPEKLVIPRDDPYSGERLRYPLDPYAPLASRTLRPFGAVIPAPLIPFDHSKSTLTVTVVSPSGERQRLGPAPLVAGQNDASVLRPDYVIRDRIVPPVPPTYGNPSLADMYHLTGRGTFDYAFPQYGHYIVKLDGSIEDLMGASYSIFGTYDVYVAKPLDIELVPEPGTPLSPDAAFAPQVRVNPAMPAEVEILWHHYPHSDSRQMVTRMVHGRANRWGVFVPTSSEDSVSFRDPGEYVCDVTVRHTDEEGVLWMATRRGASVVVTPDSRVVVHGERGNRSPTARWRARWFVAGDGRFVAPPWQQPPVPLPEEERHQIDLGHTCYPYESGDVAWLGHSGSFSLFPNLTLEDPEGSLAKLIEDRCPSVRRSGARAGLYPYRLTPEDRRAIGELPYACMTSDGRPPSMSPEKVDQWGYFYTTSWRPGVGVRSQVSEDMLPVGYWFFDDPYGYQFGNGPQGDLPGDFKMNYGGGVFRDQATGLSHYGAYASMLVVIDERDPRGARVLPPFNGLLPCSPPCGSLIETGGKAYDLFLTFAAVGPGAILDVGDRIRVGGVVWPPVAGHVEGEIVSPSGDRTVYKTPSDVTGVFDYQGVVADQPGVWLISAEGVCWGKTSAGLISDLVPKRNWPRGGGLGLSGGIFPIPVVPGGAQPIAFDLPIGSRARPPLPLVLRGHLPPHAMSENVKVLVTIPGQVIDQQVLRPERGTFEYAYDPRRLRRDFPNIDTRIEVPHGGLEHQTAWFDTVTFTFWAGHGSDLTAGMVLLQGEDVYAHATTGKRQPLVPKGGLGPRDREMAPVSRRPFERNEGLAASRSTPGSHSSLLALSLDKTTLFAGHPWSEEVVKLDVRSRRIRVMAAADCGGQVASVAISPNGRRAYAALPDQRRIAVLDAESLQLLTSFSVPGEPRAVLPSVGGNALFIADFDGDRILRIDASTGELGATSPPINRPVCLARSADGHALYTVSFRTGEIVELDGQCQVLRRFTAPTQLNQCRTLTIGPAGRLFAPQTRSDTVVGGRMFDRSVFPVIAVADPAPTLTAAAGDRVRIRYFPDLVVVPPHRPAEVAVDSNTVYLASAGSDDVLALDRETGFARWHVQQVGLEPGGIVLDAGKRLLYVSTVTGQEIIALDARNGEEVARVRFANDPTPPQIARGRYLFGTATDSRLTKDQWMSCAVCHPDGDEDGRQWDFGAGPLDTRSLRGCTQTAPLHITAHIDEVQDTFHFTRMTMAGQWFVSNDEVHDVLGESNAGLDVDLDALAAYIASLKPKSSPEPPAALRSAVERGREIFFSDEVGCRECHPPPLYTDSGKRVREGGFVLHDVGTRLANEGPQHARLDTPSLRGLRRSEPYLHHGLAQTLEQVFTKYNANDEHGQTSQLSLDDIGALVAFLRHLAPIEDE